MTLDDLRHKESRLVETLLSALDAREAAQQAGSSMLVYLAELLAARVREELIDVRAESELLAHPSLWSGVAANVPPARQDDQQV